MTNPEVEAFLKTHHTVIIPTGATEQHGPHGPLLTDVLIPQEVARRVAPTDRRGRRAADQLRPVVSARRLHRASVHIRIPTFMALVADLCASFAASGLQAHHFPERTLRQHLRYRLRLRRRGGPDAERRQGVSDQLLGRSDRGRRRRVLRTEERAARERRGDVGGAGDQSEPRRSRTARTPSFRRSRSTP